VKGLQTQVFRFPQREQKPPKMSTWSSFGQKVAEDQDRRLSGTWLFEARDLGKLVETLVGVELVAIDAPAQASSMPHRDDATLSPKFGAGRCGDRAGSRPALLGAMGGTGDRAGERMEANGSGSL
jgi:hypothetical protein